MSYLRAQILTGFLFNPFGKEAGLSVGEGAIEKAQGLYGCDGASSPRFHLAGIRTVESTKNIDCLHAYLVRIDHAFPAVSIEGLFWMVVRKPSALVEEIKPAPATFEVKLSANI